MLHMELLKIRQMKPINGNIIVKITKQQWNDLFVKKIKRDDGTYADLFLNVESGKDDDRRFTLNIQSAEVVSVSAAVKDVFPGDIALIEHTVSTDDSSLIEKNDDYELRCINAITTVHEKDEVAYANRRSPKPKDQVIAKAGDYDQISPLLGVIRHERIIARSPYIFLHHESNIISKVSASGLLYEETQMIYERMVLASAEEEIRGGDILILRDFDVFHVKAEGRKMDVIFSKDALAIKEEMATV
jgi:hypothetical protein